MTELKLAMVALVVPDYDDAIAHYCGDLDFALLEDTPMDAEKRWVVVSPGAGSSILLAKAKDNVQRAAIGWHAGGRVGLFLHSSDFDATYRRYRAAGVQFLEQPRDEAYGKVFVFADKYGNKWDLIEPR
jgi:catechol 2,3-dioxygenase-like lactoylglutathione lyase family enzyme